jgi:hypothetical protein
MMVVLYLRQVMSALWSLINFHSPYHRTCTQFIHLCIFLEPLDYNQQFMGQWIESINPVILSFIDHGQNTLGSTCD